MGSAPLFVFFIRNLDGNFSGSGADGRTVQGAPIFRRKLVGSSFLFLLAQQSQEKLCILIWHSPKGALKVRSPPHGSGHNVLSPSEMIPDAWFSNGNRKLGLKSHNWSHPKSHNEWIGLRFKKGSLVDKEV